MSLYLPASITLHLKRPDGSPLPLANVIFEIQTFATQRNDVSLFPFATDAEGTLKITKKDLQAAAKSVYDTGVMDYCHIESAHPRIEIILSSSPEIEKVAHARGRVWTSLLAGEKEKWSSVDELRAFLRAANNHLLNIPEEMSFRPKIQDEWTKEDADLEYELRVMPLN